MTATLATVLDQLADATQLRRARIHPVNVLVALRTYASGQSARGQATWVPVAQIVDALDAAFYTAFGTIEPAGKRTMLALDVSGSMTSAISGLPLSCREAAAALALVTAATEPQHTIVGFTTEGNQWGSPPALSELKISPRQRLDDAINATAGLYFGGTDCAQPMLWARKHKVKVDTFAVYTDNETWAGDVHPHQALRDYRDWSGIDARLVVLGMTATDFTIADPTDPGMLDIAGFDSAVPTLLTDFSARAI